MQYISTVNMKKEDWLINRKRGIGGSEAGAILGFSKYATPYQIWKDKVSDEPLIIEENSAMHFGNVLEDVVAKEYMARTGRKVVNDNKIRFHEEHPCLLVNLDRIIIDNNDGRGPGVLEIKTASSFAFKQWEASVPLSYYAQVMHELSVTGYKWGEFAILIDGREFKTLPFERDENYISKQNEALVKWWNTFVLPNVPPPLTAEEFTFVPTIPNAELEADEETVEVYKELLKVKQEKKEAEEKEKYLKGKIQLFLEDKEILTYHGIPLVTWKASQKETVDTKKLKKELPEIARQYIKTTSSRTFLTKEE